MSADRRKQGQVIWVLTSSSVHASPERDGCWDILSRWLLVLVYRIVLSRRKGILGKTWESMDFDSGQEFQPEGGLNSFVETGNTLTMHITSAVPLGNDRPAITFRTSQYWISSHSISRSDDGLRSGTVIVVVWCRMRVILTETEERKPESSVGMEYIVFEVNCRSNIKVERNQNNRSE